MMPSISSFSARRIAAAVGAAAFVAAAFVQFDATPRAASSPAIAGVTMMRLLGDEHAAIAGYLQQDAEARTLADQSAARDLERMKHAALEEAQPAPLRLAQAPVREAKAKAGIVRVATGAPMQLLAMTATQSPPPQSRAGAVRVKLRQLASTVERIPSWVGAAAGWVVEAVPVPSIPSLPSLPMRHFRV